VLEVIDEFGEKWFKWISWVILTAALWAASEKTDSILVWLIFALSALIVFVKGWLTLELLIDKYFPHPNKLPEIVVHIVTFIVAIIPFFVVFFIGEILESVIKTT